MVWHVGEGHQMALSAPVWLRPDGMLIGSSSPGHGRQPPSTSVQHLVKFSRPKEASRAATQGEGLWEPNRLPCLARARRHARQLVGLEPRAAAPTGFCAASDGVRPAMPPLKEEERKKKKKKKKRWKERKKKKRKGCRHRPALGRSSRLARQPQERWRRPPAPSPGLGELGAKTGVAGLGGILGGVESNYCGANRSSRSTTSGE